MENIRKYYIYGYKKFAFYLIRELLKLMLLTIQLASLLNVIIMYNAYK